MYTPKKNGSNAGTKWSIIHAAFGLARRVPTRWFRSGEAPFSRVDRQLVLLSSLHQYAVLSCDKLDHDSLVSFYQQISFPAAAPLNWSSDTDCCQWEGIACTSDDGHRRRVTHLWLPERGLYGTITPFLANLSFISHLNLSNNHFLGPFPLTVFHSLHHLQALDLSSNQFNGSIDAVYLRGALNLVTFNVSNNSFTGPIPPSICRRSPFLEILDFSMNKFSGQIVHELGGCSNLKVFRASLNSLSGCLPPDLYGLRTLTEVSLSNNHFSGPIASNITLLSNLKILELHVNELSGELPRGIGLLSNLEQLQIHTNSLNGTLPHSLVNGSNLKTLLLRNNHFGGEISVLDFSKLQRLQVVDFGNNSFVGNIPGSLCSCKALTAVRLAYNKLVGEIPPCMASLTSLRHLSFSDNYLSNVVGALKILRHCENLEVLFMSRCFKDERVPDDNDLLHQTGFQNLHILTMGGCELHGEIPSWIAKLRKLIVLNLSYNKISGPIPTWLGDMPSLFVLNLTQNFLFGNLPREIGHLQGLIADNASLDLSSLALPFLFNTLQYNRLFNVARGLKLGNNNLSGNIPEELGSLKLLQLLDLNNNKFNGHIPDKLSRLVNLERLDLSSNNLSGEIPKSLSGLHFLSSFSVANNDLEGEIPRGGQFETFSATSFAGNPKLCGYLAKRSCSVSPQTDTRPFQEEEEEDQEISWYGLPLGLGYSVGLVALSISVLFSSCWRL
ncbi:Leucine-rich repeat protein [Handroanthus impetiginosus]|uniref:Leucine-rich repeat protein n=1 Tax=Handroanthus impetiginosus TaxID=429701 RepID=A0A2G9GCH9_9LAMI|nr:Leucine-rich repeat protein [Handroanthus impetiginosus]